MLPFKELFIWTKLSHLGERIKKFNSYELTVYLSHGKLELLNWSFKLLLIFLIRKIYIVILDQLLGSLYSLRKIHVIEMINEVIGTVIYMGFFSFIKSTFVTRKWKSKSSFIELVTWSESFFLISR